MIFTEAEAKKKWCPAARVPSDTACNGAVPKGAIAINRAPHGLTTNSCIASECAAWREWSNFPATGYCGLAGKP